MYQLNVINLNICNISFDGVSLQKTFKCTE